MSVQTAGAAFRRCSLRELHEAHDYSLAGDRRRCDGLLMGDGAEQPPLPAPVIRYVFPLDGHGRRAYVHLPEDLSATEARRLAAMLDTLPLPTSADGMTA